jgi:hypothetical protein
VVDEIHYSVALGESCCERCHCDAAPPISLEARRWRPPKPAPPKPVKPTPYGRLVERVYGALQRAGVAVTGSEWSVFGLGDPTLPYMGWCPVCERGTVAIELLDDPPRLRLDGCSAGCPPKRIVEALK